MRKHALDLHACSLYIGCLGFSIETAMSYVGTLPGAEHQLPLLRFGQPQVDGNVRDCQDLPGGPEQTWRQCVEQSALLRFAHAFSLVGMHPCCNQQGGSTLIHTSTAHEDVALAALLEVFIEVYVYIMRQLPLPAKSTVPVLSVTLPAISAYTSHQ